MGGGIQTQMSWGRKTAKARGSVADSSIIDDRDQSNSISPNGNAFDRGGGGVKEDIFIQTQQPLQHSKFLL